MYKILKNTIEMDDYSVQKLSNLQPPEPFEWNTVEGTELNISDCIGGKGRIEVKGNTEQKQLSGKNLYNDNAQITEYYINGSGKRVIGSNGDTFIETVIENNINSDYVISFKGREGNSYVRFSFFNEDTFISRILLTTSNDYVTVPDNTTKIYIHTDKRETKYFTELQIEQGSIATSYEPYCGGQASPNPSYPQEIEVVTGSNTIHHIGKNWFNSEIEHGDISYVNGNNSSSSNGVRTKDFIPVLPNKMYTLGRFTYTGKQLGLRFYDKNKKYLGYKSAVTTQTVTFNTNEYTTADGDFSGEIYYIKFIDLGNDINALYQLELGSVATPYEIYKEKEYQLSLGDIELCKIRDYEDTIFKNIEGSEYYNSELVNNEFYKYNRIIQGDISSLANPTVITTALADNLFGCVFSIAGINKVENEKYSVISNILSSKVLGTATDTENKDNVRFYQGIAKHTASNNQIVITVDKSYLSEISAQGLVNFLEDNNFYFYYILGKATYEQITDPTLISQLEALRKAKWFKGLNHWWTETNNLEPVLKGTYRQAINE